MLDQEYVNLVKQQFNHHYQTVIGEERVDRHHIHIFTTTDTNDAIITYLPAPLSNRKDNDGYIEPRQPIICRLIAHNGKWDEIVNQSCIHACRFAGDHYNWNLNYRTDNAVSFNKEKSLAKDLRTRFHVKINKIGELISSNTHLLQAFQHIIAAIQYLQANGEQYTTTAQNMSRAASQNLSQKSNTVKKAEKHFQNAKKLKPSHRTTKRSSSSQRKTAKSTVKHDALKTTKQHNTVNKVTLKGKHIVLIGSLPDKKSAYTAKIKALGGILQQRVNGKTDYVAFAKPSKSASYKAAQEKHLKNVFPLL